MSIGGQAVSDSAPTLIVTAPKDGAVLSGAITINGVATSGQFKELRTEIGAGLSPTSWIPVDRKTTPVLNSTIASWNTAGVDDGAYTLRIVLTDSAFGDAVTEMTVVVRNKGSATATPTPRP